MYSLILSGSPILSMSTHYLPIVLHFIAHYYVVIYTFCSKPTANIQIWHPCGVSTRNNFPERGLSLESVARGQQSSWGEVIPGGNPTGMSYLFYYTEENTKGGNYKHQRFWINTRRLPYWTSFTGRSLGKLRWCFWVFFGLAVTNQITHGCCHGLFKYPMAIAMRYSNSPWQQPWAIWIAHKLRTTACR